MPLIDMYIVVLTQTMKWFQLYGIYLIPAMTLTITAHYINRKYNG